MTQLDALDDEIFQQIQENGIAYQSLIREVSLLEHRISVKQKQNNELCTSKSLKINELAKSNEVLTNLSAAQEINEKTTLDMKRLRNQYEQHIAPHLFVQTHNIQKQQNSARAQIISQLNQDCKQYVDLYESAPEVKSFRSEEEVLRSNEAQSEEIEAQIKTVRQHINLVSNNLKASERTFIIQMINIALKETEIYQQINNLKHQTELKRRELMNCVSLIQTEENMLTQKSTQMNEIKNQKVSLVFSFPVVVVNNDNDLPSRSPEISSFIPETDETFDLDNILDKTLVVEDDPDPQEEAAEIHRELSSLSLSGQQKHVRFDPVENENQNECSASNGAPLAQDPGKVRVANSSFGVGSTSGGPDPFFNSSNAGQVDDLSYNFNNSKDEMDELTEPNTQQNSAQHKPEEQLSFEAFESQTNVFSISNFNLNEDDQGQSSAKRPKFDFSLSRTTTEDPFTFEAFDNAEIGNASSCGFNFNDDTTEVQEATDFDFGDPNESGDKGGNLF